MWTKNDDLKGTTQQQWKHLEVPLGAWAGKTVQLRWSFDIKDVVHDDKTGMVLDEIEIGGGCP